MTSMCNISPLGAIEGENVDDSNDNDRIIDRHELGRLVPFNPSHLARLEAVGLFPKRIRLGPARVGWSLREVTEWIKTKKLERQ
jgi:prophage regulatory protein